MSSVIDLYEALSKAEDERTRAKLIVEAIARLEERYPHLPDLVTQQHLRETELRLKLEIEQLRGDVQKQIEELRGEVQKQIEQLRGEVQKQIEELRGEFQIQHEKLRGEVQKQIEQLRGELKAEIERSRNILLAWIAPLLLAQVGAIAALVKLL